MTRQWDNNITLGDLVAHFDGVAESVVDYGVGIVAKASRRDIPKDTGRTARSQVAGRRGRVGYVAFLSSKSVPLHEKTTERHPNGGRAKFLESNLASSTGAIRRRAIAEFRAAMEGGR